MSLGRAMELAAGVLMFVGVVLAGLGFRQHNALWQNAGLGLLGLGALLEGLRAIVTGRISFGGGRRSRRVDNFQGIAARLLGIILALIGSGLLTVSFLQTTRPTMNLGTELASYARTGFGSAVIAGVAGLVVLLWGLARVVGSMQQNSSGKAVVFSLPSRLLGVLVVLIGLALIGYGVAQFTAPQMVAAWQDTVLRVIGVTQ